MKVLVVDDSKLARMSVAKVLHAVRPDWTRVEAANADEALALVRNAVPDIAVFDFNMPGRDGLALAAEMRAANPAMPIAIISANHQQEIVEGARALGASFLPKPLTEQALREFVIGAEKLLKARRQ
jgi:DNA-binding NarL/FixJ family response regulator